MLCPNSLDTGRKIVILDSVGYTSESIYEEANARIAEEWVDMLKKYVSKAQIRFEGPGFSVGTSQKSAEMYFSDNLSAMNRMGFGWYITGFFESLVVQKYKKDILAGGRAIKYKSYRNFNPELLLKLQECQF